MTLTAVNFASRSVKLLVIQQLLFAMILASRYGQSMGIQQLLLFI